MSQKRGRKVERDCPICGATYRVGASRLRHGRGLACGRACGRELAARRLRRRTTFRCPVCATEFSRAPSQIKSKHEGIYCSRACHYAGRRMGLTPRVVLRPYHKTTPMADAARRRAWATRRARGTDKHTDETRARLRETTARAIAEGRIPVVSKLERDVGEALRFLGLPFEASVALRDAKGRYAAVIDYVVDGVALEVNGAFWHADPREYAEPHHAIQRHNAERFQAKESLLRERGIPLAVLWERDFRQEGTKALLRTLAEARVP